MKSILSEAGFAFNATTYIEKYGNDMFLKLQRKYTVRTVDRTTKIPRVTKLFNMIKCNDTKIIEFPRFVYNELLALNGAPSIKKPVLHMDVQLPFVDKLNTIEYNGQSNPNQQIIVKHIMDNVFNKEFSGVTLKLLPGHGKTFCAMDIIGKMKLKTLIVVPNTYLLDQWMTLLNEYFPTCKIGSLYGKHKEDGDIIVSIINTAADLKTYSVTERKPCANIGKKVKYMSVVNERCVDTILQNVGLTIFDESQMYASKEFRKVFKRLWSRYTIGLSATPDIREDKLDIIHQLWLGPILDAETLDGYNVKQDSFSSEAKIINYHATEENCKFSIRESTGLIEYSSVIEAIINDDFRNGVLIDEVIDLMDKGYYTFVFSDRRCHLENLYELLEEKCKGLGMAAALELPESEKKVLLYGGSSSETIDRAKIHSTVIFTTYAYSSTGVSITKMNAIVLSTPRRSNMKQIINRVFRLGSDQSVKRMIIDIADAKLPLKSQIRERVKAYDERGSEIIKVKIDAK